VSFDLGDYKEVSERVADLFEKHPDARLRPANPEQPFQVVVIGDKTFIAYAAECYRSDDDKNPSIGVAWEPFPGTTPYTKNSELQNAETSAWGRAIIAAGASTARQGIASAGEVRNRRAESGQPTSSGGKKCAACGESLAGSKAVKHASGELVHERCA
jgi:hypothetical protein